MPPMTGTSTLSLQLEQIADTIPEAFEASNELDRLIQDNGNAVQVSDKLFRIPNKTNLPGSYAITNLDNNTTGFPAGGSTGYAQGTLTTYSAVVPIEWTEEAKLVAKRPTAITNPVTDQTADAMRQMNVKVDMNLSAGDGTGTIGTVIAVNGNTLTLDSTSYGTRLISLQQYIQVFNGTALRPSGNAYGNSCLVTNKYQQLGQANTITLDTVPAGTVAGDLIKLDGVANGAPVATNGILSYLSNAQTGITLNTNRATNPWLIANGFDVTGGQVTLPLLRLMLDQIVAAKGMSAAKPGELVIHTYIGQVNQYEQLGEQFAMIPLDAGKGMDLDPMFRGKKSVDGHPILANIHAHAQRWDALRIKAFLKIKKGNPPYWFDQDGMKVFPVYAPNGSPTPAVRSFMIDTRNYAVNDFTGLSSLYNTSTAITY